MEVVRYVSHLEWRLRLRRIPRTLPERVYREADERFYDVITGHEIAVKRLTYRRKRRDMMVAYDRGPGVVELVTIHPLQPAQKQLRIRHGRWKPL